MELQLSEFLQGQLFMVALVFSRVGTSLLFMPGMGESYIPTRVKVLFATSLAVVLASFLPLPATVPESFLLVVGMIASETVIGLWIGLMARVFISALQFAGFLAGQSSALANAFAPNMGPLVGSTVMSTFLIIGGITLVFVSDVHHIIIRSYQLSYIVFPIGDLIFYDLADQFMRAASGSLALGLIMGSPFVAMGVMINVGMGLANRMMPSLPVFFVATSVLIGLGIFVMGKVAPIILELFVNSLSSWFGTFIVEGGP